MPHGIGIDIGAVNFIPIINLSKTPVPAVQHSHDRPGKFQDLRPTDDSVPAKKLLPVQFLRIAILLDPAQNGQDLAPKLALKVLAVPIQSGADHPLQKFVFIPRKKLEKLQQPFILLLSRLLRFRILFSFEKQARDPPFAPNLFQRSPKPRGDLLISLSLNLLKRSLDPEKSGLHLTLQHVQLRLLSNAADSQITLPDGRLFRTQKDSVDQVPFLIADPIIFDQAFRRQFLCRIQEFPSRIGLLCQLRKVFPLHRAELDPPRRTAFSEKPAPLIAVQEDSQYFLFHESAH